MSLSRAVNRCTDCGVVVGLRRVVRYVRNCRRVKVWLCESCYPKKIQ